MKIKKTERLALRVPEADRIDLLQIANIYDVNYSVLIRDCISKFINREFRKLGLRRTE
jgi:hypothetical protein